MSLQFKTGYEKSKWTALEQADRASLERMSQGQATPSDIKRVQALVSKYNTLASNMFKKSIEALEVAASSRVEAINEKRVTRGKPPLDEDTYSVLLELALEKAWADNGAEIAVVIESEIEKANTQQTGKIAQLLERMASQQKEDLDEALEEPQDGDPNAPPDVIRSDRSTSPLLTKIKEVIENKTQDIDRKIDLLKGGMEGIIAKHLHVQSQGGAASAVYGAPADAAPVDPLLENSTQLAEVAAQNAEASTDLKNYLQDYKSDGDDDKKEDKKAKVWWRSLKGWMGSKLSGMKSGTKGIISGLLLLGGRLLASQLMGGTFMQTLEKYFSDDAVSKMTGKMLDLAKSGITSIIQWIIDKLNPFNETAEDVVKKSEAGIKNQTAQLSEAEVKLAEWEAKAKLHPNDPVAKRQVERWKKNVEQQKKGIDTLTAERDAAAAASIAPPEAPEPSPPLASEATSGSSGAGAGPGLGESSSTRSGVTQQEEGQVQTTSLGGATVTKVEQEEVPPLSSKGAGTSVTQGASGPISGGSTVGGSSAVDTSPTLGNSEVDLAGSMPQDKKGAAQQGTRGVGAAVPNISELGFNSSINGMLGAINLSMFTH